MEDENIVVEEETQQQISGYIPFAYECDYCGETHEGFIGIFITLFHTLMSVFDLVKKAFTK